MDDRVGLVIKRAEQTLIRAKSQVLNPLGLTVPQYAALLALREDPGISSAELARRCLVTPQTMSTVIKNLEDKQAIGRRPHPSIGHVQQAFLTPRGEALLAEADRAAVEVERQLANSLSPPERSQLANLLERCIDALGAAQPPDR